MFNFLGHKGNANQKYIKISTSLQSEWQLSSIQTTTNVGEDEGKRNP
jgi:hypothetical protein